MSEVVRVLDERRWRTRCYRLDFLALGAFVVVAVSLFYDMYSFGASAVGAAAGNGVYERDRLAARMIGEALVVALSFAWLSYRVVLGGHRALEVKA